MLFVFRKQEAIKVMENFSLVNAYQPGHDGATATGYLVPPIYIAGLISVPVDPVDIAPMKEYWSTSQKGDWTVSTVERMIRRGQIPGFLSERTIRYELDAKAQQKGSGDIIYEGGNIEIKADWRASFFRNTPVRGCSGYLFVQFQECNPLRRF